MRRGTVWSVLTASKGLMAWNFPPDLYAPLLSFAQLLMYLKSMDSNFYVFFSTLFSSQNVSHTVLPLFAELSFVKSLHYVAG